MSFSAPRGMFENFLRDVAFHGLPDSQEDSQEDLYEDIAIQGPNPEDTQLFQEENETREVALFLKQTNGKVQGPELPPFQLPVRWDFQTLLRCISDHIERYKGTGSGSIQIDNLYYKKSRGKSVVIVKGDSDLPAVLREYPLALSSGKRKKKAVLYMAADYHEREAQVTPRRSPRIQSKQSKTYNIFLYEISAEMKLSSTANVIHGIKESADLNEITSLIKSYESNTALYTPVKGLYWLLKKQPISLRTDDDLQSCKGEYKGGNLKLACRAVNLDKPEGAAVTDGKSRKRRLDMTNKSVDENEEWNSIHVQLVRDLEKKGLLWRYNSKHLTLWTDEITKGNSAGVTEEPNWEDHLTAVIAPPKSRRLSGGQKEQPQSNQPNAFEMMMTLEAKRNDTLQSAILMMLAQQTGIQMPRQQREGQPAGVMHTVTTPGKEMNQMTVEDCISMISSLGLAQYTEIFRKQAVDGPMLEAFLNPQFGKQLMLSLGVSEMDCLSMIPEMYRIKARGYNQITSTTV